VRLDKFALAFSIFALLVAIGMNIYIYSVNEKMEAGLEEFYSIKATQMQQESHMVGSTKFTGITKDCLAKLNEYGRAFVMDKHNLKIRIANLEKYGKDTSQETFALAQMENCQ